MVAKTGLHGWGLGKHNMGHAYATAPLLRYLSGWMSTKMMQVIRSIKHHRQDDVQAAVPLLQTPQARLPQLPYVGQMPI